MNQSSLAAHAVAYGYEPKYPPGFEHFDYVNPHAPQGGQLTLSGFNTFDSLNPFLLKGVEADGISGLVFESLMVESLDEPYTMYGLLADDIQLAEDGLSVTFHINPKARFSDGSPVGSEDVKFTFDTITQNKQAHPYFRIVYEDVEKAVLVDPLTIRFEFKKKNPEIHMFLAGLSVFPKAWAENKEFEKLATVTPYGSGPYLIKSYDMGKRIIYEKNPNYWAKDLNVQKGRFNFEQIVYKYYRDMTITLEAFKAGEFDFRLENNSKMWARDYKGRPFKEKKILKENIKHKNSVGIQGFVMNTRKTLFKDKKVREALILAYDFEWANRMLFYNQYQRNYSYFSNTDLAAAEEDLPSEDVLEVLTPYKDQLDPRVFKTIWKPPVTTAPHSLRENLREALKLLKQAGWSIKDGALKNTKGQAFEFDLLLAQKGFERIAAAYARNLEKLGIKMDYRTVDLALYKRRVETQDFEMIVTSYPQKEIPGNELINRWHSSSADVDGSFNYPGIKHPVVDELLKQIISTKKRDKLIALTRALDRILLFEFYLVPHWYISTHRIAYWNKFERADVLPLYFSAEGWVLSTWWFKPEYLKI